MDEIDKLKNYIQNREKVISDILSRIRHAENIIVSSKIILDISMKNIEIYKLKIKDLENGKNKNYIIKFQ